MGRPIKIAKAQQVLVLTATTASTGAVTVSGGTEATPTTGLLPNMPFVVASTTGGLVAGTIYYILSIIDGTHFTVSATDLSANVNRTPVTLTNAGPVTVNLTVAPVDAYFNNPVSGTGYPATNTSTYSVVGGNTSIYGKQVLVNCAIGLSGTGTITTDTGDVTITGVGTDFANDFVDGTVVTTADGTLLGVIDDIANANATSATFAANAAANVTDGSYVYATAEAGFIVRQKGKTKYLVKGATTGLVGPCWTANVANANLTPNTMTIIATYANTNTALVQSLSDHVGEIFGTNETIPNGNPIFATFNTAYAANTYGGQPYPIVTINNQ